MQKLTSFALTLAGATLAATQAHAYIGPGIGAGVVGTVLGVLGAIVLALFAAFYYPIKRALKKRRSVTKVEEVQKKE